MADQPVVRARRHEAAGEIDQALAAYREVKPDSPDYEQARIRIVGIALMRGNADEAEREARAFIDVKPARPESHATLGQVLRLTFRHDDAIAAFQKAAELAPELAGYRTFLNDARRARYWSPDPDLLRAMQLHVGEGTGEIPSEYRLFHLRLLEIMTPGLQQWLTAADTDEQLPDSVRQALDARSGGHLSQGLTAALSTLRSVRRPGSPYSPARARVTLAGGAPREGTLEDGDSTIGAALEAIEGEDYAILPFGGLGAIEFAEPGPYRRAKVTPRSGQPRNIEVPSLYFFTEGSRSPELRAGRRTAWRMLAKGLHVGLGQRTFMLDAKPISIDRIAKIELT